MISLGICQRSICSLLIVAVMICNSVSLGFAQEVSIQDVEREANAGRFEKAYQFLEQLAENGNAQAQGFLAYVLAIGEWNIPVDTKRAEGLLEFAIDQGDGYANLKAYEMNEPDADIKRGDFFVSSDDYNVNLEMAAKAGHSVAQFLMATKLRSQKKYDASYALYKKSDASGFLFARAKRILIEDIERFPSAKDPARLIGLSTVGIPEIYLRLADAYKDGHGVRQDMGLALTYAKLADLFSNGHVEKFFYRFKKGLSKQSQDEAFMRAESWMFEWADSSNTYLGQAAHWCKVVGKWNKSCIAESVAAHAACMIPYMQFSFRSPQAFPGYVKCRDTEKLSPKP